MIKCHAYSALRSLPLYAHFPGRGAIESHLRISYHCRTIRQSCRDRQVDETPEGMFGGIQISLDMVEKAFDTNRPANPPPCQPAC